MNVTRAVLLIPLAAMLVTTGCRTRDGKHAGSEDLRAENDRLTSELASLSAENETLKQQRDAARDEAKTLREQSGSVEGQLKDLLSSGDIAGVYRTEGGGLGLDEDFAFAKGSAELNEDGKKTIATLAQRLSSSEYANSKIVVEGHTDDTPVSRAKTKELYVDNWGLSAARAAEVVRALQSAGVDAHRLHGAFRGEIAPRSQTDKSANRRVELYIK